MATRKKVEVVKKPKAEKAAKPSTEPTKESTSVIDTAMKLGVKIIRPGSHLTVTTYPDGRQELEWDDEALARDVREAIASVENKQ